MIQFIRPEAEIRQGNRNAERMFAAIEAAKRPAAVEAQVEAELFFLPAAPAEKLRLPAKLRVEELAEEVQKVVQASK